LADKKEYHPMSFCGYESGKKWPNTRVGQTEVDLQPSMVWEKQSVKKYSKLFTEEITAYCLGEKRINVMISHSTPKRSAGQNRSQS